MKPPVENAAAAGKRNRGAFLTAEWRDLVMVNYAVDPAALESRVPPGVKLDLWEGEALISLVGFRFIKTRVLGMPIPWHTAFQEVNLRFYVKRGTRGEVRRGVVFLKEIVPRRMIAAMARLIYNEPYVAMPMRHRVSRAGGGGIHCRYEWRLDGHWNSLAASADGEPFAVKAGSQEEFITEHYWGYGRRRNGQGLEYEVWHPPWRVWAATEFFVNCDAERLYGAAFARAMEKPPRSVFIASGSETIVYRGKGMKDE